MDSNKFQGVLAGRQPIQFLDRAFRQGEEYDLVRILIFREGSLGENPLSCIDVSDLLGWCRQGDFQHRLATLAKHIFPFSKEEEQAVRCSRSRPGPILDEADDVSDILMSYARSIQPSGCSGSRADIIARRLRAFERLLKDPRPRVRKQPKADPGYP